MRGSKAKAIRKAVYGDMSQMKFLKGGPYCLAWHGKRSTDFRPEEYSSLRERYQGEKKL